jgi:hypothetical protein
MIISMVGVVGTVMLKLFASNLLSRKSLDIDTNLACLWMSFSRFFYFYDAAQNEI